MPQKKREDGKNARTEASRKYNERNYARIFYTVPKSFKDEIKTAALAAGQSLNSYITQAVRARLDATKKEQKS